MAIPIPVNIVTGFLGSGKTTLIQHVLNHGLKGNRVAVIVNDIAEYNIDGQILTGMNIDQMVQLTSGCLCCSGIRQMGLALQEISETADPSLILIETSGASVPGPVVAELGNLGYRTDAIIAIVDAEQFLSMRKTEPILTAQVEHADFIVVNKVDLTGTTQREETRLALAKINRRAHLIETTYGRIGTDLLFATGVGRLRQSSDEYGRHLEGIEHFTYGTLHSLDLRRLEKFLKQLPRNFYRAKGFLRISGKIHPFLLNYTCGRYILEAFPLPVALPASQSFKTQLVFVGRDIKTHEEVVHKKLNQCISSKTGRSIIRRLLFR